MGRVNHLGIRYQNSRTDTYVSAPMPVEPPINSDQLLISTMGNRLDGLTSENNDLVSRLLKDWAADGYVYRSHGRKPQCGDAR
jgi:hypothetical protein